MSARLALPLFASFALAVGGAAAQPHPPTTVLVVYQPGPTQTTSGLGDARQLRQLLGHFNTAVTLQPADTYGSGQLKGYDVTFFIGFMKAYAPPQSFLNDVLADQRTFVWLNTGLVEFGRSHDLGARYGFVAAEFDTTSVFDSVKAGDERFTKMEPNVNRLTVVDPSRCEVLATTSSARTGLTVPYAVRSGNFWCFADSPFSYATETDRYLYFADLLHDILGQDHPHSHSALIRIEDTNPFSDPASLREIADLLSARGVPFLVGVIPFYVDPASSTRVAMSEKPDYVDAIRYMMEHGGTVVLHGDTHQYKGETATDYEFWDESGNRVRPDDSAELVNRKLREAIAECIKNGVYPLVWETPHYGASTLDYSVIAKRFSTVMEQRLVLDNLDYSQFFPYLIDTDMYGERIYPENLGYIPLDPKPEKEQAAVDHVLAAAKVNLAVRDGIVAAFFHPFVPLQYLTEMVDGIKALGYVFLDVREASNTVTLDDRAIVSGDATIKLTLDDQYLRETYLNADGQVVRRELSKDRIRGPVQRTVELPSKWIYVAEPRESRERPLSFWEKARKQAVDVVERIVSGKEPHQPANVLFLYDPRATGGALNDQASLAAPFVALGVPLQRVPVTSSLVIDTTGYNLVIVPYPITEDLTEAQVTGLESFVSQGGNLITDFRNDLATAFGVRFLKTTVAVDRVRDRLFPDEPLHWRSAEVMNRFEVGERDEILAVDDATESPIVIGRRYGRGAFIFFGTRFDPVSTGGYSRFPYLAHYVESFFHLTPLVRRDQLEMYFDPGYRRTVSEEQLVPRWAAAGIRVIYVGGWHEYPKYTYDYARLIHLAHASGILVYLWLEPPQVSQMFWQAHPEWREKNFKGQDVQPSWRFPVALTDRACLAAAMAFYRRLMTGFDWDGVNIGELCFEAGKGVREPLLYTPMHASARSEFRAQSGFDPAELLKPASPHFWRRDPAGLAAFSRFRVATTVRLHDAMLSLVDSVRATRPGFQAVVTVYDSVAAPELRGWLGVDAKQIAALRAKHDFILQVEDPASMWSTDPRRYEEAGTRYGAIVDAKDFALDLNILAFRGSDEVTPFPTRIQTGTESSWLVHSAALGADRVAIYSESSINQQDLTFLPYAYAARTRVTRVGEGWAIDTPTPIVLQLDSGAQEILRDRQRTFTIGSGRFLLPAGSYTVTEVQPALAGIQASVPESHLLSITGQLLYQNASQRSVEFGYRSRSRCIVTLSREPFAVFIDDRETPFQALKGDGRAALILPPGEHKALVVTQSKVSYGVDITSFWSSYVIAIFGAVSVGLLAFLYLVARLRPRSKGQAA